MFPLYIWRNSDTESLNKYSRDTELLKSEATNVLLVLVLSPVFPPTHPKSPLHKVSRMINLERNTAPLHPTAVPWHLAFTHQTLVDVNGIKLTKSKWINTTTTFSFVPLFLVIWLREHKRDFQHKVRREDAVSLEGRREGASDHIHHPLWSIWIYLSPWKFHFRIWNSITIVSHSALLPAPRSQNLSVPLFQENTQPCIGFYSQSVTTTCLPFLCYPIQTQWAQ